MQYKHNWDAILATAAFLASAGCVLAVWAADGAEDVKAIIKMLLRDRT